jgi:hypothetical protein
MAKDIKYNIEEHIATISKNNGGWALEINKVSWGDNKPAKIDVRAWNEDHTRMGKGLRLSAEEYQKLQEYFRSL